MRGNLKYLLALDSFDKFGSASLRKLLGFFSCAESAFTASSSDLIAAGINEKIANEFIKQRQKISPDAIVEDMQKEGVKIILLKDNDYPPLLSEIYEPPLMLYYKGDIKEVNPFTIAMVGTRKFSAYGKMAAERITKDLVLRNCTIVSGLALGIDTISHHTALNSGGRTVGVLGTGVDRKSIYPSSNCYLADRIIDSGGMIISEFPLKTLPLKYNFPRRNRIISGLSLGTLVVEAGERSGALITANFALEQNREVFAIPGNIFSPVSKGPNKLIRAGAKPVLDVSDIMESLDSSKTYSHIEIKKILPETNEEKAILTYLSHDPKHADELVRLTKLSTSVINSTLTIMEMKGMAKNIGGMMYVAGF
jgi:DNA processing protein